ncbi:MAG: hypothetical protein ACRERC_06810 [Candidatus Binatia bacterium]
MRHLRFFLILLALVPGGCALLNRVPYSGMSPRLAYQGFSFERPPNSHWYLLRNEESHTDVTLRRETDSKTHSLYARVALASIARQPESHEDFAALLEAEDEPRRATYEVRELSDEQSRATIQNQWCIRFDRLAVVSGAPVAPNDELRLIVRGYRCLHPAFPKTTLDFFYSERGLPSEFNSTRSEEGETFLRGVRIDVAPGTPAA